MTTVTAETTPTSASFTNSTYFAVPVASQEGGSQNVLYFSGELNSGPWVPVASNELNAYTKQRDTNKVTLFQPSAATVLARTSPPVVAVPNVTLFAAVARTLNLSESHSNYTQIGADGGLDISVSRNTTRGVILIFTKSATPGGEPTELIASPDPEIKNSIGGMDGGGG
jgi:hypothetical protein